MFISFPPLDIPTFLSSYIHPGFFPVPHLCRPSRTPLLPLPLQEYKRKQIEEQRQAERLQRQLQQERAYLVSLQQQQQEGRQAEKKPLYHYKDINNPSDKPAWAKEVSLRVILQVVKSFL